MDIFTDFLCNNFKSAFKSSLVPSCLKLVVVTPLHKKCKIYLKVNCKPVSIPPTLSKLFQKITLEQITKMLFEYHRSIEILYPRVLIPDIEKLITKP